MEEYKKLTTRDELKKYFAIGDYPTEDQFAELIDSYVHLNELNFGLDIKPSGSTEKKYYHFYIATNIITSGKGHITIEDPEFKEPQSIEGYVHVLSRSVYYKNLNIKLIGEIDIEKYQPKIIIERYKQRKKLPSGFVKRAGFYQENPSDAEQWNRKSEYVVTANEMVIDIAPINYFRPNENYKQFSPSGSFFRVGSFKYSDYHNKPFSLLRMKLQIDINGNKYTSHPVDLKIILGSSGETDAINFIIN